uniref:Uncharacterized protein n=1 Tax=Anguilla anguilla TaxID=7936 RepID=A0A0E9XJI3_ANGAN
MNMECMDINIPQHVLLGFQVSNIYI